VKIAPTIERGLCSCLTVLALSCASADARVAPPLAAQVAHPGRAPAFVRKVVPPAVAPGLALGSLGQEVRRAMKALGGQSPAPYFIAYALSDRDTTVIVASDGNLDSSTSHRRRVLDVDVRVGSRQFDSSRALRGVHPPTSVSVAAPIEDDGDALRAQAWLATLSGYQRAAARLADLQTHTLLAAARADAPADFSEETPATHVEAPARLVLDRAHWEARLRRATARLRAAGGIVDCSIQLEATTLTRSFVSSEGAVVQTSDLLLDLMIRASTRAQDGELLASHRLFHAREAAGLPSDATLDAAADRLIADLQTLRNAPRGEPFVGPALLEGQAAGVLMHETLGHRLEVEKLKDDEYGQTFARRLGQAILPSFLSVYDDPTLGRLAEVDLRGSYRFDDEGVAAQRALLVEDGVLRGFLLGRTPLPGFSRTSRSTGHGRRQEGQPARSRQGVLVVEASQVLTRAELRARLIAEARRQGKTYGLLISAAETGATNPQAGQGQGLTVRPTRLYRVYVDGRPDQRIRGVNLVGTPLTLVSKIAAAGDDYTVYNAACGSRSGYVPVSAVSPSLFVSQIEVESTARSSRRPPLLAPPPFLAKENQP
jgi:TldD protein